MSPQNKGQLVLIEHYFSISGKGIHWLDFPKFLILALANKWAMVMTPPHSQGIESAIKLTCLPRYYRVTMVTLRLHMHVFFYSRLIHLDRIFFLEEPANWPKTICFLKNSKYCPNHPKQRVLSFFLFCNVRYKLFDQKSPVLAQTWKKSQNFTKRYFHRTKFTPKTLEF